MGDDVPSTAKGGRALLYVLLFGLTGVFFFIALTYLEYYFAPPFLLVTALAVLAAGIIAAAFVAVKQAKHKLPIVLALLVVAAAVVVSALFMSFVLPLPVDARVAQIVKAADFTLMLPAGETMEQRSADGYQPSCDLTDDGEFSAHYKRFDITESACDPAKTAAELDELAQIETPGPEAKTTIVVDRTEEYTLFGKSAIGVVWHEEMAAKTGMSGAKLIFQPEGLLVTLTTDDTDGAGLTLDELVELAETFEPAR